MLKKRLIFTLLYDDGSFVLSRNFRLQRVGDLEWLNENYNFDYISRYIDELIVLDVTRDKRNRDKFSNILKQMTKEIFTPIASGGGINSVEDAKSLLNSGADKIILNTSIFTNKELISKLSKEFGQQCIIASIDIKKHENNYSFYIKNGTQKVDEKEVKKFLSEENPNYGELYINSIDKEGTGMGYDIDSLNLFSKINVPIILSGGAGNSKHLIEGLRLISVDGVATSHLFNFIGNGLRKARMDVIRNGIMLPIWDDY